MEKVEKQPLGGRDSNKLQQPDSNAQVQLLINKLNHSLNLGLPSLNSVKSDRHGELTRREHIVSDLKTLCLLEEHKLPLRDFETQAQRLCSEWSISIPVGSSLSPSQRHQLIDVMHRTLHAAAETAAKPPPKRDRNMASPESKPTFKRPKSLDEPLDLKGPTLKLSINPVPPPPLNPDGVSEPVSARSKDSCPPSSTMSEGIPDQFFLDLPINGFPKPEVRSESAPMDPMSTGNSIQERLKRTFPAIPARLKSASLRVIYEITRVFLHAEITIADELFPSSSDLKVYDSNYDTLWTFLRNIPALKGKRFPEQTKSDAWAAAGTDSQNGSLGVVFAGSLKFNSKKTGPLFQFRLSPIKLEQTHRLGRRLTHNRFLEIDMPGILSDDMPDHLSLKLKDLTQKCIWDWFWAGPGHSCLGYKWKPFFKKDVERKPQKQSDQNLATAKGIKNLHRVYFFAVAGRDLRAVDKPLEEAWEIQKDLEISVGTLLEMIRSSEENKHEPALKLFSRTALALSRNAATVVFEKHQIRHVSDRYVKDVQGKRHLMTDGAGWISPSAAEKIKKAMGLLDLPAAFQGRIGSAKGLWGIDFDDTRNGDWIDISDSQRKWKDRKDDSIEADHPSHRTFEVLDWVHPLSSGKMSLQMLQIFMSQAINADKMRGTLHHFMEQGLEKDLETLTQALTDPKILQHWAYASNPNINDKLNSRSVPSRAGLPISLEDQIQMLVEGGFTLDKNAFLKDRVYRLLQRSCEKLEDRLAIPIPRSTYVFITPDRHGILKAGEVYFQPSSSFGNESGISGERLVGRDLLITRSPAHFASDVQRVKVAAKEQFMGIYDIMICSTESHKGGPSVADFLSGGDYDGDKVLAIWEPEILDNFIDADVPTKPNLMEEGFIRKDRTTYEDLTKDDLDPTSWLKHSFEFHMQPQMLGVCTIRKDQLCIHSGTIDQPNEVAWHTLLGLLVDQSKQGISFGWDDLRRFENKYGRAPSLEFLGRNGKPEHITSYLKRTTKVLTGKCLTEFQKKRKALQWDEDLVRYHRAATEWAEENKDWKALLKELNKSVSSLRDSWKSRLDELSEQELAQLGPTVDEFFQIYQAIQPNNDNPLAYALNPPCLKAEGTQWALLRASALFWCYSGNKEKMSDLPWRMAGRQLIQLKANSASIPGGVPHSVIPSLYVTKKPNIAFIKRLRSEQAMFSEGDEIEGTDEFEAEDGE